MISSIYNMTFDTLKRFKSSALLICILYVLAVCKTNLLGKITHIHNFLDNAVLWSVLVELYFENRASHPLYKILGLIAFIPFYYFMIQPVFNTGILDLILIKFGLWLMVLVTPFIGTKTNAVNIFSFQYRLISNYMISFGLLLLVVISNIVFFTLMEKLFNIKIAEIITDNLWKILGYLIIPIILIVCIPKTSTNHTASVLNNKVYRIFLTTIISLLTPFYILSITYTVKVLYQQKLEHADLIIYFINSLAIVGIIAYLASYCIDDNKFFSIFKKWFFPLFLAPLCLLLTAKFTQVQTYSLQKLYYNRYIVLIPCWIIVSTFISFVANKDNKPKYIIISLSALLLILNYHLI